MKRRHANSAVSQTLLMCSDFIFSYTRASPYRDFLLLQQKHRPHEKVGSFRLSPEKCFQERSTDPYPQGYPQTQAGVSRQHGEQLLFFQPQD